MIKSWNYNKYGNPEDVLHIQSFAKPSPKPNEVCVKIMATAINDYDWGMVTGKPGLYKLLFGFPNPKHNVPGMELSGVVEAVGTNVERFKIGDAVFGDISNEGFGTFAEYICIDQKAVIRKPDNISFEEATTIPHAALLALQALKKAKIAENIEILVNGAGGGVGVFAVQIAKRYNCKVTGVDAAHKHEMMTSIGYDEVIDYRTTDFTKSKKKFDLILDCKTKKSAFSLLKVLKKNGHYISIGGDINKFLQVLIIGKLSSPFTSKRLEMLALKANEGLDEIVDLHVKKPFQFFIDGPHSFESIPKMIQFFGDGKHKGKIVIKV